MTLNGITASDRCYLCGSWAACYYYLVSKCNRHSMQIDSEPRHSNNVLPLHSLTHNITSFTTITAASAGMQHKCRVTHQVAIHTCKLTTRWTWHWPHTVTLQAGHHRATSVLYISTQQTWQQSVPSQRRETMLLLRSMNSLKTLLLLLLRKHWHFQWSIYTVFHNYGTP